MALVSEQDASQKDFDTSRATSTTPCSARREQETLLKESSVDDEKPDRELTCWELLHRLGTIGLPLLPGMLMGMCSGLVSLGFVGQLNTTEMTAALGLCNVMMNILGMSWIWGMTSAINTLSSQDWGAGCYHAVGITLQRGIVLTSILTVLPLGALWLNSGPVLEAIGQPPEVVVYVARYTRIRLIGLITEVVNGCFGRTLCSIGNTRIGLYVMTVVCATSFIAHAVLIPWLGWDGFPLAIVVCDIAGCSLSVFLAFRDPDFRRCWPGLSMEAFRGWIPYLRLSIPSFVLLATEAWCWQLQDFLAGLISTNALATNAIAPTIVLAQYCIGGSLGNAACTVVGNLLGEGRPYEARRAARLSVLLVAPCFLPTTILLLAYRGSLPYLFTEDAVVAKMVRDLLVFTQIFALFDSHQAALTGILNGAAKQSISAPLIFVCYWIIGIPLGVVLAFGFFDLPKLGLFGLWLGMIVAVVLHVVSFGVATYLIDWDQTAQSVSRRQSDERPGNGVEYELTQL